jgi:CHAD domain-containing protein
LSYGLFRTANKCGAAATIAVAISSKSDRRSVRRSPLSETIQKHFYRSRFRHGYHLFRSMRTNPSVEELESSEGRTAPAGVRASFDSLGAAGPLESFVYRQLSAQAAALGERAAAAQGGADAEAVHRLRVATRRARSALKSFRGMLRESLYTDFHAELRWLAGALGHVRDLDVYRGGYLAIRATLPAEDVEALHRHERYIDAERQRAESALVETLGSERCRTLLHRFASAVAAGLRDFAEEAPVTGRCVSAYIAHARKPVLKQGNRIGKDSPPDQLHVLRIRVKRFRYLLEFFLPLHESRLEPGIRAAIRVQDVLGLHQDACSAVARLRRYAATVPAADEFRRELLALGQIIAAERAAAKKARKSFAKEWRGFKRAVAELEIED